MGGFVIGKVITFPLEKENDKLIIDCEVLAYEIQYKTIEDKLQNILKDSKCSKECAQSVLLNLYEFRTKLDNIKRNYYISDKITVKQLKEEYESIISQAEELYKKVA